MNTPAIDDASPPQTREGRLPSGEGCLPASGAASESSAGIPRLSSQALFNGCRELEIEHAGAVYRLRITSMGRLILTK